MNTAAAVGSTKISLNDGNQMPKIGLGTYMMSPKQVCIAMDHALGCGYRLFDTATVYRNEEPVGKALSDGLSKYGLMRGDIFVTSKLAPDDHGFKEAQDAVLASLRRLGLDQLDLYLIHWPGSTGLSSLDPQNISNRIASWQGLQEAQRKGHVRSIGVSNFEVRHLQNAAFTADQGVTPAVNQIELHPAMFPTPLVAHCQTEGILVQAYSPLGRSNLLDAKEDPSFLAKHSEVLQMSQEKGCSVAQLLLRWSWQHGWSLVPKSIHPDRITTNLDIGWFELTKPEMEYLDCISQQTRIRTCWDPRVVV